MSTQTQEDGYTFVRLDATNMKIMRRLFDDAPNIELNQDQITKKYDTTMFGHDVVGYIALAPDQSPAGFYGVFPITMRYKDKTYLAAQSGDTFTHANHRGKGLFVRLAKATYQTCKEEGIRFVYGFPNEKSHHGLVNRLEWKDIGRMQVYSIAVKSLPLVRLAYGKLRFFFRPVYRWIIRYQLKKRKVGDTVFQSSCHSNETVVVEHGPDLFKYKQYSDNHVARFGQIRGWISIVGHRLFVGDLESGNDQQIIDAIEDLKRFAFWIGANEIYLRCSPGCSMDRALSTRYTAQKGGAICYLDLGSDLPLDQLRFVLADSDTF